MIYAARFSQVILTMKIFRAGLTANKWKETDEKSLVELAQTWEPKTIVEFDATIEKEGQRHTTIGLQIEADDIIALSNALLIFQRNRILELEARVKNFSKIQSSLKQIEQLASYPREQVAMRHLALIQKIAHRSRSSA